MALTVDEAIRHIKNTLASDEIPAVGALRILNDAGELLCSFHHWQWLIGRRITLHFEANQGHVWLPRDFRDIVAYDATQGLTTGLSLTTHQYLVELRTSAVTTSTWRYWGAVTYGTRHERATGSIDFSDVPADGATITLDDGYNPTVTFEFDTSGNGVGTGNIDVDTSASGAGGAEAAAALQNSINDEFNATTPFLIEAVVDSADSTIVRLTNRETGTAGNVAIVSTGTTNATITGMSGGRDGGRPLPRLDIWPDPTADLENAITLYYRAGWEWLDQDTHEVSVPEWLETAYLQLVRAHARGYEREDVAPMEARVSAILAGPHMLAALKRDAEMQPDYGALIGGAAEVMRDRYVPFWNFGSVAGPS